MSRQKLTDQHQPVNYDLSPFMPNNLSRSVSFQHDSIETLREKLQIKSEALNLLAKQIELCNKEKTEYKRLIDTLYDKNLSLKKSLYFKENEVEDADNFHGSSSFNSALNNNKQRKQNSRFFNKLSPNNSTTTLFSDIESEDYMKILKDLVKTLQKEKHELIQKFEDCEQQLQDSRSDLRLLREQIVRQRVGGLNEGLTYTPDVSSAIQTETPVSNKSQSTPQTSLTFGSNFRENLIKEIENLREQKLQVDTELKLVLCQKEEIEVERDQFKIRFNKLNQFLNEVSTCVDTLNMNDQSTEEDSELSNHNQKRMLINKPQIGLNIDELLSQNKYLTESNQNLIEEIQVLKNSLKKLKQQTAGSTQSTPATNKTDFNIISSMHTLMDSKLLNKKQVELLFVKADEYLNENSASLGSNQTSNLYISIELISELKMLSEILFEHLNDKLIANVHQRKVNKMLAARIQDMDRQLNIHFLNCKGNLTTNHCSLPPTHVIENSLNDSIEIKLVKPLAPNVMLNEFNIGENENSDCIEPKLNSSMLISFDDNKLS